MGIRPIVAATGMLLAGVAEAAPTQVTPINAPSVALQFAALVTSHPGRDSDGLLDASDCVVARNVATTTNIDDFPALMRKRMPGLGASDAHFRNPDTDVGENYSPDARLLRAFHRDHRWVVFYVGGGVFGTFSYHVLAMDMKPNGDIARQISNMPLTNTAPPLCDLITNGLSAR